MSNLSDLVPSLHLPSMRWGDIHVYSENGGNEAASILRMCWLFVHEKMPAKEKAELLDGWDPEFQPDPLAWLLDRLPGADPGYDRLRQWCADNDIGDDEMVAMSQENFREDLDFDPNLHGYSVARIRDVVVLADAPTLVVWLGGEDLRL